MYAFLHNLATSNPGIPLIGYWLASHVRALSIALKGCELIAQSMYHPSTRFTFQDQCPYGRIEHVLRFAVLFGFGALEQNR